VQLSVQRFNEQLLYGHPLRSSRSLETGGGQLLKKAFQFNFRQLSERRLQIFPSRLPVRTVPPPGTYPELRPTVLREIFG